MTRPLALVLLVAVLARLAAWGVATAQTAALDADGHPVRPFVVDGDAAGYWDLAGDLAAGREYAVHEPPRRVMRTPGLPAVLAVSRLVAPDSTHTARGWLAALSMLGPWLVYQLGRELAGEQTGLIAAALVAVSPLTVAFAPLVLSESLFGIALTAQMLSLARLRAGCWRWAIAAGLAGAAACYLRPAWCPAMAAIPVGWAATHRTRSGLGQAAVIAFTFAVCWMPWVVRNHQVVGQPVLTTLWTGPTLYDSVGPQADGRSDMTFFDADADERRVMSEAAVNDWYTRRSLDAITADPGRLVRLAVVKQARFWQLAPSADEAGPRWLQLPIGLWTAAVLLLAVAGWIASDWSTRLLAAGPVLALAAVHLMFVASLRYRVPCELPLAVLTAIGGQHVWGRVRRRGRSVDVN